MVADRPPPGGGDGAPSGGAPSGPRDLPLLVGLDDVALVQVLEVGEADAALEALVHLAHVILEAPQRGDGALPDHHALAQEAHLRAAGDDAAADVAAGDRPGAGDAE